LPAGTAVFVGEYGIDLLDGTVFRRRWRRAVLVGGYGILWGRWPTSKVPSLGYLTVANSSGKDITVINLPANSWTSMRVYGQIRTSENDVIEAIDNPDRIEFVAYYLTGKRFSYEIDPERQRVLYYSPPLTKYQRGS
jgi:hypothetical protein